MRREATIQNRYEIIDYIEVKKLSIIDTGVSMTGTTLKIDIDYKIGSLALYTSNCSLWGASNSDSNWCMIPYIPSNTSYFQLAIGSTGNAIRSIFTRNQRNTYSAEINTSNHSFSVNNNGSVSTGSWSGSVSSNNIFLFCHNAGNDFIWQTITTTCYACQITLDGVLVRDYVPARDTVTGLYGLYDNCESVCPLTGTSFYIAANIFTGGNL